MNEFFKKVLLRLAVIATVAAILAIIAFVALWFVRKNSPQTTVKASVTKTAVLTESLSFHDGEGKIEGVIYRPEGVEGNRPSVIYCQDTAHGDRWCREMAGLGYIAYCFNLGEGENERAVRVKKVIEKIRAHRFTDKKATYLLAEGNGCPAACAAAFDNPDKLAGLILVSPGFNPLEAYRKAKRFRKPILVVDSSLGISKNVDEIAAYIGK